MNLLKLLDSGLCRNDIVHVNWSYLFPVELMIGRIYNRGNKKPVYPEVYSEYTGFFDLVEVASIELYKFI